MTTDAEIRSPNGEPDWNTSRQMDDKTDGQLAAHREPWAVLAEQWSRLGPPLRPSLEDMQRLRQAWLDSLPEGRPRRRVDILLLGVTPEVANFPWADEFHLTALDASAMMIRAVWPGDAPGRQAVLGDWLKMPFADASFDLVLCDCGLVVVADTGLFPTLGGELQRVLRPAGRVAMRHFSRPTQPESTAAIVQAVEAGTLRNFNELKLRLLLSLHGDRPGEGVGLSDALECFERLFPDRAALAAKLGCPLPIIATIDAYRRRDARYTFPTLAEVAAAFTGFNLSLGPAGHYGLAECCPVFSLSSRP